MQRKCPKIPAAFKQQWAPSETNSLGVSSLLRLHALTQLMLDMVTATTCCSGGVLATPMKIFYLVLVL